MPNIAFILLNWKNSHLAIKLIKNLKNINTDGITTHFFLIDNHSPDNSFDLFQQKFSQDKDINLYQTKSNLGFAGGVNFGLKKAISKNFDYALLINSDTQVSKDFLIHLLKPFKSNKKLAVSGPKIYFAKGYEYHKDRYKKHQLGKVIWSVGGTIDWQNIYGFNRGIDEVDHGQFDTINTDIDFISGCCMLINLKIAKKIDLFDPNYFMYLEDADYCQRLIRSGYLILYVPKSIIWHLNAGSSQAGGDLQQYFLSRNRLLFASKFVSLKTKFALFRQSIKILITGKYKWQKLGTLDFYLKNLGKGRWK